MTDAISTSVLLKALDALSLRATVTAENIANANSPGYRPLKITFEEALRSAAGEGRDAVDAVQPRIAHALSEGGSDALRVDLELATATATAGRYGALAELLNRQLQLQALAVSGVR